MLGGLNYGSGGYGMLEATGTLQTVTVMETVNRADSFDTQTDFTVSVQETATRTDNVGIVSTFLQTIQETVNRADSFSVVTTFTITIQETVSRVAKWIGNFWTLVNRVTNTNWTEDNRNSTNWTEDDRNPPKTDL